MPIYVNLIAPGTGQTVSGQAFAILDSGADETTLPWRMIGPSGASWDDLPKAGKDDEEHYQDLFNGLSEPTRRLDGQVYWRDHLITGRPLIFPPEKGIGDPVLGRRDFFALFEVTFRWGEDPPTFTLTPR